MDFNDEISERRKSEIKKWIDRQPRRSSEISSAYISKELIGSARQHYER